MEHAIILKDEDFEEIKEKALQIYRRDQRLAVNVIMDELMDLPFVPMHYPYHHFIMPAALLTAAALELNLPQKELEIKLSEAIKRSKNVLPGFCGFYGACGSGLGLGIFVSILTETSPMSTTTWQWTNQATAIGLQAVSAVAGPRCCKRTGYLALIEGIPYLNEKLELTLTTDKEIVCKYYEKNAECKKAACPFYKVEV